MLPPGSIIGILGGGQLGRMTALAAAKLGYRSHIFCPGENEPAVEVSNLHTKSDYQNTEALKKFAQSVDVVTLEWENVPISALETIHKITPVHPSAAVMEIAQNRVKEKNFARSLGIGTAEFVAISSADDLSKTLERFSTPAILKSTRMGYDGKGQVRITDNTDPYIAWKKMGSDSAILEAYVDFECEISVIVVRSKDGTIAGYSPMRNVHRDHILAETHVPAGIDSAIEEEALALAVSLVKTLDMIGLLAVELFVLKTPNKNGQRVIMNEIAPRPHNSGHWTMDAAPTSQFEQLVRAVCGLPLGAVMPIHPCIMHNLIGDDLRKWPELLANPRARIHLYGKKEPHAGRKMGHVTFV